MKYISTSINIKASASNVWRILTNFAEYPTWNPFIKSIEGKLELGEKLKVTICPPGIKPMTFHPKIISYKENHHLTWQGHLIIPGLFDGEHSFEIYKKSGGVIQFIQKESFTGLLVPFLSKNLDTNVQQGFKLMNKALKEKAEQY